MKITMGSNKSTQKMSFWNFLQNNKIEIPIIQRDYAQGRLGKEYLRRSFLSSIKEALDDKSKSLLKLDFVYGSTGNGKMLPLDGQQRLTTLWLLHWYIALYAEALDNGVCHVLSGFSYETRISSREFCYNLCIPEHFEKFDGNDVVGFITTQTWFYSAWKQDPTIQSMLRMLSGTKINDKNGEDIIDGIEELFNGTSKLQFKDYWQKLRSNDAPIVFYFLPLNEFKLTDDLYIKMNARGKQLTSFENFKADLIGYMTRQFEDETLEEIQQKEWNELLNPQSGIPIKLDTDWTDIFWKNKSKDNRIDEIYFAFLNRFFLNELVCQKDNDDEYIYTAKQLEDNNPVFSYLYGNKSDDTSVDYVGFEKYKDIPLSYLKNLSNTLNRIPSDINLSPFNPNWVEQDFQYIPIYKESSISSLEQKDRIAFHAISKYIQKGTFDAVSYQQWMRVVWNIVENAGVNSISSMIGVMRLIDELAEQSHRIYKFLSNPNSYIKSKTAQKQVREEMAKAKQIIDNPDLSEIDIKYAEKHSLLKGCISAIFEDDSCSKVPFNQTIQERIALLDGLYKEQDKNDYYLVKVLISHFEGELSQKKELVLKKDQSNWKTLITDNLKGCFRRLKTLDDWGKYTNGWKGMLSKTLLLENSRDDGKILGCYDGDVVLWATNGCTWNTYDNVILDPMHCNQILSDLIEEEFIQSNQKVSNCCFFSGWHIDFKFRKNEEWLDFQWNTDGFIYLMRNGGALIKDETKEEIIDKFYCFTVADNETKDSFVDKLGCLIAQAFSDEENKKCCDNCQEKICESTGTNSAETVDQTPGGCGG